MKRSPWQRQVLLDSPTGGACDAVHARHIVTPFHKRCCREYVIMLAVGWSEYGFQSSCTTSWESINMHAFPECVKWPNMASIPRSLASRG